MTDAPSTPLSAAPSPWLLLRIWLLLGFQSFGGGTATLTLIRQTFVERNGWLTEAEFTREWALCQLTPGINLLALTILIGRRLAGGPGILVSLLGLLLPSVALTVIITAFYTSLQHLKMVQAALHGVIPATVGLGLVTSFQMVLPPLKSSRSEGKAMLALSLVLLVGSGLAVTLWHKPVVLVLFAAAAVGALAQQQKARIAPKKKQENQAE